MSTDAKPGQFAVTNTGGWAAKVIQWVTRSDVNHALVCVSGTGPNALCVEAQPKGAQKTHARNYPDALWTDFDLTDKEIEDISSWALDHLGTKYGWWDCVAAGLDDFHKRYWWFPAFKLVNKRLDSIKTMDCSQLVTMDYTNAGFALVPDEYPSQVSPGDLKRAILKLKDAGKTRPNAAKQSLADNISRD